MASRPGRLTWTRFTKPIDDTLELPISGSIGANHLRYPWIHVDRGIYPRESLEMSEAYPVEDYIEFPMGWSIRHSEDGADPLVWELCVTYLTEI